MKSMKKINKFITENQVQSSIRRKRVMDQINTIRVMVMKTIIIKFHLIKVAISRAYRCKRKSCLAISRL